MNKYKIAFIAENILILALALSLSFMGIFSKPEKPNREETKEQKTFVKDVQVIQFLPSNVQTYISADGRVVAADPIVMASEVQGRILAGNISLKAGVDFNKGDLLFAIDDLQAKNALIAKRAGFIKVLANIMADLKIDYANEYTVWKAFYDQIDIQKRLPNLPQVNSTALKTFLAKNSVLTEYYSIQSEEKNLDKYKVYAPYSGSISDVYQTVGNRVNPGSQVIRIINTSAVEMSMSIEAKHRTSIQIGNQVSFYAKDNQQEYIGTIDRIGDVINPNTQSIDVFVKLKSKKEQIYEGMYLSGEIHAANIPNALEVSKTCLTEDGKVYLLDAENKVYSFKPVIHQSFHKKVIIGGWDKASSESFQLVLDASEVVENEIVKPFQIED